MTDSEVLTLAVRQLADYDALQPGAAFAEPDLCLGLDDAYRVQIATARLRVQRGETIAGYKIGCVSGAVRRQLGTEHAVFGHLFSSEVRTSPARLRSNEYCRLAIEGELALVLERDLDDLQELCESPRQFVRESFPVIELHHYSFRGPRPSAAEVVANNALQAGIVVPRTRLRTVADDPLEIRVAISDRINVTARVDPLKTVHELASRLSVYHIMPKAGQILLTGSPLPLYTVESGDRISVDCPGIASVAADVS